MPMEQYQMLLLNGAPMCLNWVAAFTDIYV